VIVVVPLISVASVIVTFPVELLIMPRASKVPVNVALPVIVVAPVISVASVIVTFPVVLLIMPRASNVLANVVAPVTFNVFDNVVAKATVAVPPTLKLVDTVSEPVTVALPPTFKVLDNVVAPVILAPPALTVNASANVKPPVTEKSVPALPIFRIGSAVMSKEEAI